jgi:hypothetical protein
VAHSCELAKLRSCELDLPAYSMSNNRRKVRFATERFSDNFVKITYAEHLAKRKHLFSLAYVPRI